MRATLQQAMDSKPSEAYPTAAQHQFLIVDRRTSEKELTLELIIVLSRWGLVVFNEDDLKVFLNYLCCLFPKPNAYRSAAEDAVGLLFTNWVLPNNSRNFNAYAQKIVWSEYARGARRGSKERSSSARIGRSAIDLAELKVERIKRGERRQRTHASHLCVPELAQASGVDPRRIYEAIKARNLPADKIGQSLRVDNETANNFIFRAHQKRKLAALRKKLCDLGQGEEAVRKWIYRLRKNGASETKINHELNLRAAQLYVMTVSKKLAQLSDIGKRILKFVLERGHTPIRILCAQFGAETATAVLRLANLDLVQDDEVGGNRILSVTPEFKAALCSLLMKERI